MRGLVCVAALAILAAGCSDGAESGTGSLHSARGEDTIENIVAPQIGLGPLDASCSAPDGLAFGDEFDCAAETESGDIVLFRGRVSDGAVVDMQTLNVLTAEVLGAVEVAATDVLVEEGLPVSIGAFECGDGATVFDPAQSLLLACRVLHPFTGRVHAATVTVLNASDARVTVAVAEDPLPSG